MTYSSIISIYCYHLLPPKVQDMCPINKDLSMIIKKKWDASSPDISFQAQWRIRFSFTHIYNYIYIWNMILIVCLLRGKEIYLSLRMSQYFFGPSLWPYKRSCILSACMYKILSDTEYVISSSTQALSLHISLTRHSLNTKRSFYTKLLKLTSYHFYTERLINLNQLSRYSEK